MARWCDGGRGYVDDGIAGDRSGAVRFGDVEIETVFTVPSRLVDRSAGGQVDGQPIVRRNAAAKSDSAA